MTETLQGSACNVRKPLKAVDNIHNNIKEDE